MVDRVPVSWALLGIVVGALGLALMVTLVRRMELARMRASMGARSVAVEDGAHEARLQQPVVDLSRCLGCGTCVAACPEDGVLELIHGQAMVVRGARCQGISACERECPAGAIAISLAHAKERGDVPALNPDLEAAGSPGLFLAGEVTAHALVKTAIDHGRAVGAEVARRSAAMNGERSKALDLIIVGAGPAGLACSLEAKRAGLNFITIEQELEAGGAVAKYPRGKLVVSEPVDLPLHGRLKRNAYTKESLGELWDELIERHDLPIQGGETLTSLERTSAGTFVAAHTTGESEAHHVCLALGRRGTPKRLGVPGENLAKVQYQLLDANAIQGSRLLVVGGGDSAIEAALGLAEQPGNEVTLAYRGQHFNRLRTRNAERLAACEASGAIEVLRQCELAAVQPDSVELAQVRGTGIEKFARPNDAVFVMIGGTPPFALLEAAGVSFDPELVPAEQAFGERGSGLLTALGMGFVLALGALVWALVHRDYYGLPMDLRPTHAKHLMLRPGLGVGLAFGLIATLLILVNLAYLLRRSPRIPLEWGSLKLWMTSHVATGVLAFLTALLHGAMAPRDTSGGHAMWALFVLLVTGAIGRYLYAWVPRAANGREYRLEELRLQLDGLAQERGGFGGRARDAVQRLVAKRQWESSFLGRVLALAGVRRDLRAMLAELDADAKNEGVPDVERLVTLRLARQSYYHALTAAHLEDLRGLLSTWRWLHRWVAALMVLLVALHVANALLYGAHYGGAR